MNNQLTIEAEEMARLLRVRPSGVARKARRLALEHGFPRPLPGMALVWSRRLVEIWIAAGGAVETPHSEETPASKIVTIVAAQRDALERRYAGGGR